MEEQEKFQKQQETLWRFIKQIKRYKKTVTILTAIITALCVSTGTLAYKVYDLDMHQRVYKESVVYLMNRLSDHPLESRPGIAVGYFNMVNREPCFECNIDPNYNYTEYMNSVTRDASGEAYEKIKNTVTSAERRKVYGASLEKHPNRLVHYLRIPPNVRIEEESED